MSRLFRWGNGESAVTTLDSEAKLSLRDVVVVVGVLLSAGFSAGAMLHGLRTIPTIQDKEAALEVRTAVLEAHYSDINNNLQGIISRLDKRR